MHAHAVVFKNPQHLALERLSLPFVGEEDIQIAVEYSGISTGTERLLWDGSMPPFPGMGYPLVPGYETVGRVTQAGAKAKLDVGQRVFVPGANCFEGVRSLFGAQNVGVENPSWMSGGVQLLANLSLPYNRLIILGFALFVLLGMTLLISQTRLGLFVRGVTQNRTMASALGVNTARIDTYAFSLGCGIAGLAGCALSQIGNVGPDLGQSYIVDAFMVVVLGGVGQLAGTVYAALGLGLMNKLLEGVAGAVLAKIAVLVFIIVFIQKRPQGIFAMKGRSAEA